MTQKREERLIELYEKGVLTKEERVPVLRK